jgi:hypothetical protein
MLAASGYTVRRSKIVNKTPYYCKPKADEGTLHHYEGQGQVVIHITRVLFAFNLNLNQSYLILGELRQFSRMMLQEN